GEELQLEAPSWDELAEGGGGGWGVEGAGGVDGHGRGREARGVRGGDASGPAEAGEERVAVEAHVARSMRGSRRNGRQRDERRDHRRKLAHFHMNPLVVSADATWGWLPGGWEAGWWRIWATCPRSRRPCPDGRSRGAPRATRLVHGPWTVPTGLAGGARTGALRRPRLRPPRTADLPQPRCR